MGFSGAFYLRRLLAMLHGNVVIVIRMIELFFEVGYSYFIFIVVHIFIHVFKVSFELEMVPRMSIYTY